MMKPIWNARVSSLSVQLGTSTMKSSERSAWARALGHTLVAESMKKRRSRSCVCVAGWLPFTAPASGAGAPGSQVARRELADAHAQPVAHRDQRALAQQV